MKSCWLSSLQPSLSENCLPQAIEDFIHFSVFVALFLFFSFLEPVTVQLLLSLIFTLKSTHNNIHLARFANCDVVAFPEVEHLSQSLK